MKISGFTMLRDGVKFDFPFEESIRSLLPLVDELVVNVGFGTDDTIQRVRALAEKYPKILVVQNTWDEQLRKEGLILSQQTNLAMAKCSGDWGVYLQADEVLHEEDIPKLRASIEAANGDPRVDGLIFDYLHFYGDFFILNRNPSAYRREVRVVRFRRGIVSWKDAQGFRKKNGERFEKLKVKHSGARIFHYGWVRPPEVMRKKTETMDTFYHPDGEGTGDNYKYKRIYGLVPFTGTHPALMDARVKAQDWKIDILGAPMTLSRKDIRKIPAHWVESLTGWLPGEYKNFIRID